MAKIKAVTLADKDGNLKYPRTYTKLVTNSDGEDLDTVLRDFSTGVTDAIVEINNVISKTDDRLSTAIQKETTRATEAEGAIRDEVSAVYDTLDKNKANTNGYYDAMSVGVADNLVGRDEAIEREFVFEQSAGVTTSILKEDTARIESVRGNTLVYNQLVIEPSTIYPPTGEGITVDALGNGAYHVYGTAVSNYTFRLDGVGTTVAGHKYLLLGMQGGSANTYWFGELDTGLRDFSGIQTETIADKTFAFAIRVYAGVTIDLTFTPKAYDLTKMFNAGNEPTTAEEAEKIINQLNVTDGYNAGELINNNTTAIKTVGFNAWDGVAETGFISYDGVNEASSDYMRSTNYIPVIPQTEYYPNIFEQYKALGTDVFRIFFYDKEKKFISYVQKYPNWDGTMNVFETPINASYIRFAFQLPIADYKNDICINLVNTGYRNGEYESYREFTRELPTVEGGLKSAGAVYDELKYNHVTDKWEYVKRVGEVDLGSLTWSIDYFNGLQCFRNTGGVNGVPHSSSVLGNSVMAKYNQLSSCYELSEASDKVYVFASNAHTVNTLAIRDTSYTDVSAFKVAMQGVMMYYELVEPIITELDTDLSPDYDVEDWGTEEAIQVTPSAPFKGMIKYGFNAVDQIRGNKLNIDDLLTRVAALEAQLTSLTTNTNNDETTA